MKYLYFRSRIIVVLVGIVVGGKTVVSGQQIFREATETPSHRVLDGASLPGFGLPNAIQSALLRRLDQHIRSGKQIDHDRLTSLLDRMPIDPQTKTAVEKMARIMSSQQPDGPPGVPEDLQQIVSRQVEEYQANQSGVPHAGGTRFDPANFQEWLSSNRTRVDAGSGNQNIRQQKLSELYQRFQDRRSQSKRQSKPFRSRSSNADPDTDDGSLTKRILESALEAMDESSMDFLRAAKDGEKGGAWNLNWLKGATKSWNSSVRGVNRAFKKMSSTTASSPQLVVPDIGVHEDGGRRVWTTVVIVGALGLAGVLLRRRFLNKQVPDVIPRKPVRFEAGSVVDRASLVAGVNLLASAVLGRNLSHQNHGAVFAKLASIEPSVSHLSPIYAQSRYGPAGFKIPADDLESARYALSTLHRQLRASGFDAGAE